MTGWVSCGRMHVSKWMCCHRLLRHDMVAELCESAVRFQQAGGNAAALLKGATSGHAALPGTNEDISLYVYGNVEVKNLVTPKFGAGVQFEVLVPQQYCCVLFHSVSCVVVMLLTASLGPYWGLFVITISPSSYSQLSLSWADQLLYVCYTTVSLH